MSKQDIQLLSASSKILYSYFQEKFMDAVMTDMAWTDEPDAMINLTMFEMEGSDICSEVAKIGIAEITAIMNNAF